MKNIISAFTTLFFYLLCVFGAAALLTASAQTAAAKEYKADVIAEIENSSQVSDRLTVKSIVPRVFRKTLSFSWNRLSSSAGKFRNGQLPRSFSFWKQKVLWLPAF